MGRTEKGFNSLCAQRDETIKEMEKARAYRVSCIMKCVHTVINLYISIVERRIKQSINSTIRKPIILRKIQHAKTLFFISFFILF